MSDHEKSPDSVYGNYEDKYHSRNIISAFLVSHFLGNLKTSLKSLDLEPTSRICEVGCGEGEVLLILISLLPQASFFATDISANEVDLARAKCSNHPVQFSVQNAENLEEYADSSFDLVVCSEVLEHLSNPQNGLNELFRISSRYILVSVPNEPIWRILNMLRGKYIRSLGNTPGHLNHWSRSGFLNFLRLHPKCSILGRKYPFPWQMILMEKKA